MTEDAIARAKELDAHFAKTGKIIGPLHGVPISVKEHIGLKGRICNTGYVAWMDNIPTEDALIVRTLKDAGAIFHVRTNEPQSLMVSRFALIVLLNLTSYLLKASRYQ
jgi:amidase